MKQEIIKVKTYWNEQWKEVITKTPTNRVDYYISNHGRLKSVIKENGNERLLKPSKLKSGHLKASVKVKGQKMEGFYIHRLVYNYFVEEQKEEKYFIIHKDGNKENNYVKNLELLNRGELSQRWENLGIYKEVRTGKRNVKLTESKVKLLKQRLERGKTKKRILARQFGISLTQLKRIESGENWSHVTS